MLDKRLSTGLLIMVVFSGCAIGPKFEETQVAIPTAHRGAEEIAQSKSMADLPWWETFKDGTLNDLLKLGIENNYDVKAAAARIQEAKALYGIARAQIMPHTAMIANGSQYRNSEEWQSGLKRTTSDFVAGFDTAWEIDLWGKIRRSMESAREQFKATEEARRGVLITLVGDLSRAYFQLRELDLELEIANRTVETRKGTLDLFQKRQTGGVASNLEVSQAQADLSQAAAAIPDLKRRITIQENLISYLLGGIPGAIPRGEVLDKQYLPPELPSVGIPAELLRRRPDILEAENLVKAANAEVGVAWGEMMPKFDFLNFVGSKSHQFSDLWKDDAFTWSVGGNTRTPVFEGGKNVAALRAAKARWEQSLSQYRLTATGAFRDVADAIVNMLEYKNVRSELQKRVEASREGAKISRMRYEGGFSSYLEVLDADRQLFTAENDYARVLGEQLVSYTQLYRALGGGWQMQKSKS